MRGRSDIAGSLQKRQNCGAMPVAYGLDPQLLPIDEVSFLGLDGVLDGCDGPAPVVAQDAKDQH